MKTQFDIFRKKPEAKTSYRQTFELEIQTGMTLLDVFHTIQADHDPGFAYRYSCRGAICGSCAVRINGKAVLACKTQATPLAEQGIVTVDPLANLKTVKDLVADFSDFWTAYEHVRPAIERETEGCDEIFTWEDKLKPQEFDQLSRTIDCIKCAACFSDCPKRGEDENFIGPQASVQLYKFLFDPRDGAYETRKEIALSDGGVIACDSHANCVKVCPKDVRPLRAITFIKKKLQATS